MPRGWRLVAERGRQPAISGTPLVSTGYGPITAAAARALAVDADWRALLTDAASGRLLGLGQVTYRPNQALRDDLVARHHTCTFPGCARPSPACDLDHHTPYADGGPTGPDNLGPLCRRHHRLKTHGGWQVRPDHDDGTLTWTSPHGRVYHTRPPTALDHQG